jgi:pantoate--beta-alanine ligase
MEIVSSQAALRDMLARWKQGDSVSVGFVPTMGALHDGHLALVRAAQTENSRVVVSIFVNPTQFNSPSDLASYPRTTEADCAALEALGADAVYFPVAEELYPNGMQVAHYDLKGLDTRMEGAARPGHFQGVATVVDALFHHVEPDRAYFGAKDFQQVAVVRQLVTLRGGMPQVVACPTVREPDGLAMSSRNLLLTEEQRAAAPRIYAGLRLAAAALRAGATPAAARVQFDNHVHQAAELKVEYLDLAHPQTLELLPDHQVLSTETSAHYFAVVRAGNVRLIDNLPVE